MQQRMGKDDFHKACLYLGIYVRQNKSEYGLTVLMSDTIYLLRGIIMHMRDQLGICPLRIKS